MIDDNIVEDVQAFNLVLRSPIPQIYVNDSEQITVYIEDNDSEFTCNYNRKSKLIKNCKCINRGDD